MNRIAVDSVAASQLQGLILPVEIVDETGKTLGRFIPSREVLERDQCPYTPEELEEMRNEPGGCTLEELWKSLGVK